MLWPAIQGTWAVMYTVWLLDLLQINQETWEPRECNCSSDATFIQAFITRQADCTAYLLPFDTDMWCLLVTDAAQHWSQRSQMTFWIVFFFSVTKNYLFDDGHQCNPRHPDGPGGCCCLSSEITFTSNELCLCVRERGWVSECVRLCACVWRDVHVDVHVQEDASLTTHSLLDAFN